MYIQTNEMKKQLLITGCILIFTVVKGQDIDPFPLIDLHVHLKGDLTIEEAILKSGKDNVQYGIAANC